MESLMRMPKLVVSSPLGESAGEDVPPPAPPPPPSTGGQLSVPRSSGTLARIVKGVTSSAESGGKLQVRKLSFGGSGLAGAPSSEAPAAAPTAAAAAPSCAEPSAEGLRSPSVFKRVRMAAAGEVARVTAHTRETLSCLTREIALVESERAELVSEHAREIASLRAELGAQRELVERLQREREEAFEMGKREAAEEVRKQREQTERLLRERDDALESAKRHAAKEGARRLEEHERALAATVTVMRVEVRRAEERADAMEAASALLQPDASSCSGTGGVPRSAQKFGVADEERRGTRCEFGAVSLANVPAMHGGALSPEHHGLSPSMIGTGYKAGQSGGAGAGHGPEGGPASKPSRKNSFGRKAGRRLMRSLSFGNDNDRKALASSPAWTGPASPERGAREQG
jgi:hypothetical protein